jgi:hypothetical protein
MVYVYYNLRLRVKQINKVLHTDAIVLDLIDTKSPWRVETGSLSWRRHLSGWSMTLMSWRGRRYPSQRIFHLQERHIWSNMRTLRVFLS